MSQERMQVLEMLAQGKITVDEAERLLERLEPAGAGARSADADAPTEAGEPGPGGSVAPQPRPAGLPKYLRVVVDSADGDKVNVRVPMALVRTGIKLSTLMPRHASEELSERGIDLSQLSRSQSRPDVYYALFDYASRRHIHTALHRLVPALESHSVAA